MSLLHTANDPRHEVPNPLDAGWQKWVPLLAVLSSFALMAVTYFDLPDIVPIHFNARGEVDGTGRKIVLWVLPVINLFVYWLLGVGTRTTGYRLFNYPVEITEENAYRQHALALDLVGKIRAICCVLIAYTVFASVTAVAGGESSLNMFLFWGLIVLMFGVIGVGFWDARRAR